VPFTVSHVAAVLPLRGLGGRRGPGMPLAALAAGSMSPDLPYYLPWLIDLGAGGALTHSLVGILTVDLLFGAAMWALWLALAPALYDLVPDVVRERWPDGAPHRAGVIVVAALLVGAVTHVVWDAFTHVDRFGHTHIGALAATYPSPVGELPGYRYLQYASGAFALAVVVWCAWRRPRTPSPPRRSPVLAKSVGWVILAGAAVANLLRHQALAEADTPRTLAFLGVTASISGAVSALIALCLVWFADRRVTARR
jgi:hypothetical protein